MDFDRLQDVWAREPGESPVPLDQQVARARERARQLERTVRLRDRLETGGALLLLPLFAWLAVAARSGVSRLGSLLIALSCVVIPVRLWLARRELGSKDPGQPMAVVMRQELARVRAQERLLGSVLWWYLAPLGLGVVLFVAGAPLSPWLVGAYALGVVWFFERLFRLNRQAVTDELRPRARELSALIASLEDVEGKEPEARS
jgi:hypothetical protein